MDYEIVPAPTTASSNGDVEDEMGVEVDDETVRAPTTACAGVEF